MPRLVPGRDVCFRCLLRWIALGVRIWIYFIQLNIIEFYPYICVFKLNKLLQWRRSINFLNLIVSVSEILDFCEFLSPTPEEEASRSAAVESVFDVVKYIWPDCEVRLTLLHLSPFLFTEYWILRYVYNDGCNWFCYLQVEVFGSFKTGLYLPSSDIDVIIASLISLSYSYLNKKVVHLLFVYESNDKVRM